MLNKINHIGIAVKDIKATVSIFEKLLNVTCTEIEEIESMEVKAAYHAVRNVSEAHSEQRI